MPAVLAQWESIARLSPKEFARREESAVTVCCSQSNRRAARSQPGVSCTPAQSECKIRYERERPHTQGVEAVLQEEQIWGAALSNR
jgi:hypothetical protein